MVVCARRRCTTRTDEKVAAGDDGGGGLVGELLRDSAGPWFGGKHVLPRDGEAWWRLYVVCEWSRRARGHYFCIAVLLTKNCAELEVGVLLQIAL